MSIKYKINKQKLYQLYVVEKKTVSEVAEIFKVSSNPIQSRLKKYGWSRTSGQSRKGKSTWNKGLKGVQSYSENRNTKISKSLKEQYKNGTRVNKFKGKKNPEHSKWLKEAYASGRLTHPNLGKKASRNLRRKLSLAHLGQRKGKLNNRWKGGITSFTQKRTNMPFWKEMRKLMYKRDNWECVLCDKHGGLLNCHHVVPFDICRYSGPRNLITLCNSCHMKVEPRWEKYLWLKEIAVNRTSKGVFMEYKNLMSDYIFTGDKIF